MSQSALKVDGAAGHMPMAEVLGAMRDELGDLARGARQVESLLSELVARVDPDAAESIVTDAQLVDAMSQRLEALETYLTALRGLVPAHWELDPRPASALLTLSRVASRLVRESHADAPEDSGELELF